MLGCVHGKGSLLWYACTKHIFSHFLWCAAVILVWILASLRYDIVRLRTMSYEPRMTVGERRTYPAPPGREAWVRSQPTPTHKTCLLSAIGDLKWSLVPFLRHHMSAVRCRIQHSTYDIVRTMLHTTLNIRHHTFVNIIGATYDIVAQTYDIVRSMKCMSYAMSYVPKKLRHCRFVNSCRIRCRRSWSYTMS